MHRLKELRLTEVNDGERLCQILYRMPNLEKLFLWEAKHLLKESSESRLGTVLQLKELVLSLSGIKDIGFEREPVLRRLELLSLFACKKLRNLAPPSVEHGKYMDSSAQSDARESVAKESFENSFHWLTTSESDDLTASFMSLNYRFMTCLCPNELVS
ncbi:hypothetical protein JHK85_018165 [Glycine max]|nr:hypothetical protein JHK85_018165 [Glycine max]